MEWYEITLLILAIVFVILFVYLLGVGNTAYQVIFKRGKAIDFYKISKKSYAYKHKAELIKGYEWYLSLPKETIKIVNARGITLIGRLTKNQDNCEIPTVVLYSHGWRSIGANDISCMGASLLYNQGYDLFVIDQEAHGESSGDMTTFGLRDSENILLWISKINELYNNNCNIILFGTSMGANSLLLNANQEMKNVRLIIADCGFTSVYDILKYSIVKKYKLGVLGFLGFRIVCFIKGQINLKAKDARINLQTSKYPVLFIHGDTDNTVPVTMTKENYEACTSTKKILIVSAADHAMSYITDKELYQKTVLEFIKQHLNC